MNAVVYVEYRQIYTVKKYVPYTVPRGVPRVPTRTVAVPVPAV